MKLLSVLKHAGIVLAALFVLLGLPFFTSDYFAALISGVDTVSGASVIMDAPSGNYIVLINRKLHTDDEALQAWQNFFNGEDEIIFEDISCSVAAGDAGGLTMAQSFQSRLPENQMKLYTEASVMMLSRLQNDQYDVAIMSKEFAESYEVETIFGFSENTITLYVEGASDEET